jgi:hypothetical protein
MKNVYRYNHAGRSRSYQRPYHITKYEPKNRFDRMFISLKRIKKLADEINADIQSYGKFYSNQLFVIYDLGSIRDEDEFKKDLDNNENISLIIIKH